MKLTVEQIQEVESMVRPLMEWLRCNCHPHIYVNVTDTSTVIVEGLVAITKEESNTAG